MTFQALYEHAAPSSTGKQSGGRSVKDAVVALGRRLEILNIWNPPHRKTMTAQQRAAEDQQMREFLGEW